jgi:hypothetical protein
MNRTRSLVPQITIRTRRDAEAFVHRISELRLDAHRQGYGTLAHLLDAALSEAIVQADQEVHDQRTKNASPMDLRLFVRDA